MIRDGGEGGRPSSKGKNIQWPKTRRKQLPLPLSRHNYFDKLQIWLRGPLSKKDLNRLKRHCAEFYVEDGPCWWDWRYNQKIQLGRPDPTALHMLAGLDDTALINC